MPPSQRIAEAHARAEQRRARERARLRPLGWALIAIVTAGVLDGQPAPGTHGAAAGVALAIAAYVVALALSMTHRWTDLPAAWQAGAAALMGGAGVALAALQPRGPTEIAASSAVWVAVTRLPMRAGVVLAAAITVALDVALALSDASSSDSILAATLLCALLALMAHFMRQARANEERTELLLAELRDAREAEARAAALAERGRIAGELHDVLAHSLSGAAIQLQGARMLAERDGAQPQVRAAIDRASELVKDGLGDARRAVGALRGEELPTIDQLGSLVASFRADMDVDATLSVQGTERPLPPDASLALYRAAQEALTNVARYAPGAAAEVVLRYGGDRTTLSVEDRAPAGERRAAATAAGTGDGLAGVGGGRGLAGMRERVERAGGTMEAGPTGEGWRVRLEVPV